MRNKDRINPFLNQLKKLWLKEPDLRFGQVICLLQNKMNKDDIFYPEDKEWERTINELLKEKNINDIRDYIVDALANYNDPKVIKHNRNNTIRSIDWDNDKNGITLILNNEDQYYFEIEKLYK
jgi:hypothetical protein